MTTHIYLKKKRFIGKSNVRGIFLIIHPMVSFENFQNRKIEICIFELLKTKPTELKNVSRHRVIIL